MLFGVRRMALGGSSAPLGGSGPPLVGGVPHPKERALRFSLEKAEIGDHLVVSWSDGREGIIFRKIDWDNWIFATADGDENVMDTATIADVYWIVTWVVM